MNQLPSAIMAKIIATLRTHWKKSVFFTVAGVYGLQMANKKRLESALMAEYCEKAAEFGRLDQPLLRPMYNVTVILNPAASKGGARKKFDKYCAPILHLAGIKVSVMRTERVGEAGDIMEIMKDADAVLIAGGDGTVMEAVTGFMRRPDADSLRTSLPIGVLPVGKSNHLAHNLFPSMSSSGKVESEVEMMAGAAMSCVKSIYRPIDVMQVENISEDDSEFGGKKIYGVSEMRLGAFSDAHSRVDQYWFFAGLRKAATYVFGYSTAAKHIMWHVFSDLEFARDIHPETGHQEPNVQTREKVSSNWWSYLFGGAQQTPKVQHSNAKREWEGDKVEGFKGSELQVRTPNCTALDAASENPKELTVSLGPDEVSFSEFVRLGWRRENVRPGACGVAAAGEEGWTSKSAPALRFRPSQYFDSREDVFHLDGEEIDIRGPVEISLLPERIVMFCGAEAQRLVESSDESHAVDTRKWWQRSTVAGNAAGAAAMRASASAKRL